MKHHILLLVMALMAVASAFGADYEVKDSVLTFGPRVRNIPARAFADRLDFHTVRLEGHSLATIGEYAFLGCRNLREISLPASLRKIGEGAFSECESLTEVKIPKGVTLIPRQAFSWCANLRKVELPQSVVDIASHAFAYCGSLEEINFPSRLKHIGCDTFAFCASLREVSLPATIVELESYAFAECTSLRSARLPGNGNMLGELIFCGCRNLESITVNSVKVPTFDCNSTLFDTEEEYMYDRCELRVPAKSVGTYRDAQGWCLFKHITAL